MPLTYAIYKPFGMHSRFTREHPDHVTLADLDFNFPKDVYPVGRLDKDSEGLLILTNDKKLNAKLLEPSRKKWKNYWVQVEGAPAEKDIQCLRDGVEIRIKGKAHKTAPAKVSIFKEAPEVPERTPPVRFRKTVPDTWLSISITEGKNRQVRRMCAKAGFPVLRLIRVRLAEYDLFELGLGPGEVKRL